MRRRYRNIDQKEIMKKTATSMYREHERLEKRKRIEFATTIKGIANRRRGVSDDEMVKIAAGTPEQKSQYLRYGMKVKELAMMSTI